MHGNIWPQCCKGKEWIDPSPTPSTNYMIDEETSEKPGSEGWGWLGGTLETVMGRRTGEEDDVFVICFLGQHKWGVCDQEKHDYEQAARLTSHCLNVWFLTSSASVYTWLWAKADDEPTSYNPLPQYFAQPNTWHYPPPFPIPRILYPNYINKSE